MDVLWPLSAAHSRAAQRSARPPRPPSFLPAWRSDSQQTFVIWLQEVGAARGFCSQSCWLSTARTDGGNVTALPCTHTHTPGLSSALPSPPCRAGHVCAGSCVCVHACSCPQREHMAACAEGVHMCLCAACCVCSLPCTAFSKGKHAYVCSLWQRDAHACAQCVL